MGMYMAYGVLTTVMAWGMFLVFVIRNYLPLWKNRIYLRMLILLILAVVAESIWQNILPVFLQPETTVEVNFRIFINICTLFLFYQFFLYDMALTCKMMLMKTSFFQVFFCIFLFVSAISIIAPLLNLTWFYNTNLHNYNLWGNFLQILILLICLCAGIYLIIRSKNILNKKGYYILLAVHYLLVIDLCVQLVLNTKRLVSYFALSIIMILYYRLFHKNPSYISHSNSYFNYEGFCKVLHEKALYKENAFYLKIGIADKEKLIFSCTEKEMVQIQHKLEIILRKRCGRHNVYHIGDYEFAVMFRKKEKAEKMHHILEQEDVTVNGVNSNQEIPIICNFSLISSGK